MNLDELQLKVKDLQAQVASLEDRLSLADEKASRALQRSDVAEESIETYKLGQTQLSAMRAQCDRLAQSTQRWLKALMLATGKTEIHVPVLLKARADALALLRDDKEDGSVTFRIAEVTE